MAADDFDLQVMGLVARIGAGRTVRARRLAPKGSTQRVTCLTLSVLALFGLRSHSIVTWPPSISSTCPTCKAAPPVPLWYCQGCRDLRHRPSRRQCARRRNGAAPVSAAAAPRVIGPQVTPSLARISTT